MKKITLFLYCLVISSIAACTMQKEGGSWVVKKTFSDVVTENVDGAKGVVLDLKDANNDLSPKEDAKPTKKP